MSYTEPREAASLSMLGQAHIARAGEMRVRREGRGVQLLVVPRPMKQDVM